MKKLLEKGRYEDHPWSLSGSVCQVPIEWLMQFSHPSPSDFTDLVNGELLHQDEVWKDILKNGMLEPLLFVINKKSKTMRLESGNHRVRVAYADGYTHLPTAFMVIPEKYLNAGNGKHAIKEKVKVKWDLIYYCNYPYQINPFEILTNSFEDKRSKGVSIINFKNEENA